MCPNGCNAVLDTGTFLIYGPRDIINEYFNSLKIDQCEDMSHLPNIVFEFRQGKQNIEMILTPKDYIIQV